MRVTSVRLLGWTAFLAVVAFAVLARIPLWMHPLGFDRSSEALARAVCAARNFETRGFLASGGLPVLDPVPVSIGQAIAATDPPLLSWMVVAIRGWIPIDHDVAARTAEGLLVVLGAFFVWAMASRRTGAPGAFAAGSLVVLSPVTAEASGLPSLAGFVAFTGLACLLDAFHQNGRRAALLAIPLVSLIGAFGDFTFLFDACFFALAGLMILRRRAWDPLVMLALASPVLISVTTLALLERLAGTVTLLIEQKFWLTEGAAADGRSGGFLRGALSNVIETQGVFTLFGGILALGFFTLRNRSQMAVPVVMAVGAIIGAVISYKAGALLPGSQIRLEAPVALGCALAIGWLSTRWRFGAMILAGAISITLLGTLTGASPRGSGVLEALGRGARMRVSFGEALAIPWERFRVCVMAACERPVVTVGNTEADAKHLVLHAPFATTPVALLVTTAPADPPLQDLDSGRAIADALAGLITPVREGGLDWFSLQRGATSRPAPALDVQFQRSTGTLAFATNHTGAAKPWTVFATKTSPAREPVVQLATMDPSGRPTGQMDVPPMLQRETGACFYAVSEDASGAGLRTKDEFARLRTLRKIKSRALWIPPSLAAVLLAFMLAWMITKPAPASDDTAPDATGSDATVSGGAVC